MPVVAAYLYRDGARVRSVAIDEKCDSAEGKSEFVWIGLADPTAEEMKALQDCYDLHPLAVEDAINVCALFSIYDRMADSLGWYLPEPAGYGASAQNLMKRGYLL